MFPDGLPTTLLTYSPANPAGGGPAVGTVRLELNVPAVVVGGFGKVFTGSGTYSFNRDGDLADAQGNVGVRVLPNDVPGINPRGSLWLVTEDIKGARPRSYYVRISYQQTEADLSLQQEVNPNAAEYTPVVGPPGQKGDKGDQGDPGTGGGSGAPSGPAGGDLSGTYPDPSVAGVGGVAITGTPSSGQVPTATGTTAATWQTPAAPPSAAGTVTAQTAFGGSSSAGTATTYSRGDHTHGTPAAPTLAGLGGLAKASNLGDVASVPTARANLGLGTAAVQDAAAFDTAGAAGTVASALTAHAGSSASVHGIVDTSALVTTADSRLTNSRAPSGAAGGDLTGLYPNPGVGALAGVVVSGTPSAGQALIATSATAASWQDLPTGGGGGGGVTPVWYIDELDAGIIHLPGPTSSWTPVVGANSVAIARDITDAAVGDIIELDANFLRIGASMQLDSRIVVDGTPVRYLSAADATPATPGAEGEPSWYGGTSFKEATGTYPMRLGEGHVGTDGTLRLEMVYRGTDIPADNSHTLYWGAGVGYKGRYTVRHWQVGTR